MKNVDKIKKNKFFEGIDFNKLKKMELKAPYIPVINKFDYQKELKNISKPFIDFRVEPALKLKKSINDVVVINKDRKENYLEYHKNLMKWFDKF